MVAAGFVERTIEQLAGRGRPRHRFSATQAALVLLFANNQQLVVPAIWKAVHDIGGDNLTKKVLRVGQPQPGGILSGEDHRNRSEGATRQFMAILEEEGGLVDLVAKEWPAYDNETDLRVHQHVRRPTARLRDRPRIDVGDRRPSGATDLLSP